MNLRVRNRSQNLIKTKNMMTIIAQEMGSTTTTTVIAIQWIAEEND